MKGFSLYFYLVALLLSSGCSTSSDSTSSDTPDASQEGKASEQESSMSHDENQSHEDNMQGQQTETLWQGADPENSELEEQGFVFINSGDFTQGDSQGLSLQSASPSHTVVLTKAFYIHEHEVTVGEFRRFDTAARGDTDCKDDANCPVTFVSWNGANLYISWLNENHPLDDGYKYRLCSESEWEYASRAGSTAKWSSGDDVDNLQDIAWFNNPGKVGYHVKLKNPNQWGLYDMHGNMRELVADTWSLYNSGEKTDPLVSGDGPKVWKSGNWCLSADQVSSAMRGQIGADETSHVLGFRLCASR